MKYPKRLIFLCFLFLSGVLGGCPGSGSDRDAAADDGLPATGTVELGTGTVQFESMVAEQELVLIAGPQGGHHFIVHARIQNLEPGDWERPSIPENPSTEFSAFDESGQQVDLMLPPYALGYRDYGDDWRYLPSGRFLRTEEAFVPQLFGNRLRIVVRVQDANGAWGSDERWVVVVPEPIGVDAGMPPDAGAPDAGVPDASSARPRDPALRRW